MPRTNLDIIAKKYITREKLRTTNDRNNFRYPADDPEARNFNPAENRWNLSANDMAALDGYLANNIELFQDKSVLPKKVKLEDANDGLDRIKRKDYSKYSKLPDALKEYYGRKKYIELFGNDQDLPPLSELNEDQKARLDEFARDPAFRMIIATLMDRCPNDENGIAQKERLKEYDSYMSQKLLEGMLSPVTEENRQRIRTKYPNAHKGDNILEIYEEKQVFTAKTLFMTQLGRIDIRTGGNHPTVKPYDGQISELFSHGSRTMYTLPSGDETIQESMQQAWKGRTQEKGGLLVHRAATHEISRRQVNDQGEMTSPAQEKKLGGLKPYFKENGTLKIRFKPTSYFCNYGMNMPIGGMGNLLGDNTVIDDQGGFGHMYIRAKQGSKDRCGALLIGIEGSGPQQSSAIGNYHGASGKGFSVSSFMTSKKTVGKAYGGRETDLSHMSPTDFEDAMRQFDAGYRELQRKAKTSEAAKEELNALNQKLCGKRMTAPELAQILTSFGMEKTKAVRCVTTARSSKDAAYTNPDDYQARMYTVTKQEEEQLVVRAAGTPASRRRMQEVRVTERIVRSMKHQWESMKSHTLFSAWNSSEFKKMERTVQQYLKAYDNVMNGMTADGKELRMNPGELSEKDMNLLKEYQKEMQQAARDYHNAKVRQKGGGFDQHKSGQARDRDAMALYLSESFAQELQDEVKVSLPEDGSPSKVIDWTDKDLEVQFNRLERQQKEKARKMLDEKVRQRQKNPYGTTKKDQIRINPLQRN